MVVPVLLPFVNAWRHRSRLSTKILQAQFAPRLSAWPLLGFRRGGLHDEVHATTAGLRGDRRVVAAREPCACLKHRQSEASASADADRLLQRLLGVRPNDRLDRMSFRR